MFNKCEQKKADGIRLNETQCTDRMGQQVAAAILPMENLQPSGGGQLYYMVQVNFNQNER